MLNASQTVAYTVLGAGALIELATYLVPGVWKRRRMVSFVVIFFTMAASGTLVFAKLNIAAVLLAVLSIYRVINCLRLNENRVAEQYLRRSASRSSAVLIMSQALVLITGKLIAQMDIKVDQLLLGLAGFQLLVTAAIAICTVINLKRSLFFSGSPGLEDSRLPTLSVAIPARNETLDLTECLEALLASDYPKLEILVLDDCSQRSTSQIIKGFARQGVRFIKGQAPESNWLAKNQALDYLAAEASGELILFCGVDLRVQPDSLRKLVATMKKRKLKMLSLLPTRKAVPHQNSLIEPLSDWWELSLPRFALAQPTVFAACWVIEQKSLKALGGFKAVSRAVQPANYFARELHKGAVYNFFRSNDELAITSTKTARGRLRSLLRQRYPALQRRPDAVALLVIAETIFLLGPLWLAPLAFHAHLRWAGIIALVSLLFLVFGHQLVLRASRAKLNPLSLFSFPVSVGTDMVMMHRSMWQYEFGQVLWKGRNICLPVMHVTSDLPAPAKNSLSN